ncbi:MAG: hypothetical protein COW92_05600 [Candidatus Omnitrophica bacterium CG22_combo_CG10-13_8_21_14_all_43_16]|nr:MAG: hypothetical protein COW92_05600 [Candidatus Omnitrophica bacterium CG22_combo_CG10-13_8_21_14_all_43_16]
MLKRFLFVLIVLGIAHSGISYAAPCYGTHMPKEKQWTLGLEGNFLVDRDLDDNQGSTSGNRYFLTCSLGVLDWICFDGKIGMGDVAWHNSDPGNLNFNSGFAGAYGFRIKGYENKGLGIKTVAGFQHISVHPPTASPAGDNHRVIIDDWQGSALVSKDMGNLTPYAGARYGTVDYIKWVNEHDRKRIKSEKMFGAVIGFDYLVRKDTRLNIECDFLDGEELSIGISRDF